MNYSINHNPTQLLFIDATVDDIKTLLQGVLLNIESHVLYREQDGVIQIVQILRSRPEIQTVHIVCHGAPGCLYLGNSQLSLDNLKYYASQLQSLSRENLNLLLYGCNVAASDVGEEFLHKLHSLTGAKIAASATKTGNAALGGDWDLEVSVGEIRSLLAFNDQAIANYAGILAPTVSFNVSSVFNADVIVNRSGGITDTTQTAIDLSNYALITQSFATFANSTTGNGLPDNGFFPATSNNPDIQLTYRNSDNSNNARLIKTSTDSFTFSVTGQYAYVHLALTSTEGSSAIRLTFNYSDGTSQTTNIQTIPDWYNEITPSNQLYYLSNGLDRSKADGTGFENANNPAVFGVRFSTNAAKTLQSITVEKTASSGYLVFFGAVGELNTAPALTGTAATLSNGTEDTAYTINATSLLQGFTDVDGDTLSVSNLTATNGTIVNNGNGTYTFNPNANYNGTVSLNYNVIDGKGGTTAATRTFSLVAVNDAPALTGTVATLSNGTEDTAYTINATSLLQGFTDVDGDTLSVSNLTATNGTIVNNGNGTYTFNPNANYNGTVSLNYNVIDGKGGTTAATRTFSLVAVNDAPALTGTVATLSNGTEDTAYTINATSLLQGFTDVDGDTLSVSNLTATNGTIVNNGNGTYTFNPNANYNGTVSLNYNVIDGKGGTTAATRTFSLAAVNDDVPTVTNITSNDADPSNAGTINYTVSFSENVTGVDASDFSLAAGSIADAAITNVIGTDKTYTVTVNTGTGDGTIQLNLNDDDSIINGMNISLGGVGSGNGNTSSTIYTIDKTSPSVTNISSTLANGNYSVGQIIPINVTFGKSVNVLGTPQLTLNTGGNAAYIAGTGTNTLTFNYTVGAGENSTDLEAIALSLAGGTIKDSVGNDAILTLPATGAASSLGANKNIIINTTPPGITSLNSIQANGSYSMGMVIPITIAFDKAVNVTGTPQLSLNSGGNAIYANGSGTNSLIFNYTVATGQTSADLDATALALNGGTIKDIAGNNATLTLPSPGTTNSLGAGKNIIIDTSVPSITTITSSLANGNYTVGQIIPIRINFSEAVNVTGTPQLSLNSGGNAIYASGSGTNSLIFNYTVATGQTSADLDATALALNGGTIKDIAGNNATLTLPSPGTTNSLGAAKNIIIDTATPSVTTITSSLANGSYTINQIIPITVNFSEAVNVTGTPQLSLNSGGNAIYASGSGTNSLIFNYTVATGQTSADLDATALALNGGTIKDIAGNNATLTLPTPGTTNSLGGAKNIIIDTAAPSVTLASSAAATVNAPFNVTATFSENVTGLIASDLSITNGTVSNFTGTGSNYSFTVTPTANGTVTVNVPASSSTDGAGNNNLAAIPLTRTFDSRIFNVSQLDAYLTNKGINIAGAAKLVLQDLIGKVNPLTINYQNNELTVSYDGNVDFSKFTVLPLVTKIAADLTIPISKPSLTISKINTQTPTYKLTGKVNFEQEQDGGKANFLDFINEQLKIKEVELETEVKTDISTEITVSANLSTQKLTLLKIDPLWIELTGAKLGIGAKNTSLPIFEIGGSVSIKGYDPFQDNEPELKLSGQLIFDPKSITSALQLQSQTPWKNPFGLPDSEIRNLVVQVGGTYITPWIDNVGFVGDLKFGNFDIKSAFFVSSNDPKKFAVELTANNSINIVDLWTGPVGSYLIKQAGKEIPLIKKAESFLKQVLNVNIVSVDGPDADKEIDPLLKLVPVEIKIAETKLTQGLGINGQLIVWGQKAILSLNANPYDIINPSLDGFLQIPEIDLTFLKLTGADGPNDKTLDLALKISADEQFLKGDGRLDIFGTTVAKANVEFTPTSAKIKDLDLNFGVVALDINDFSLDIGNKRASGSGSVKLLGQEIAGAKINVDSNGLKVQGNLDLFGVFSIENAIIDIKSPSDIKIGGTAKIFGLNLANANISIQDGKLNVTGGIGIDLPLIGSVGANLTITSDGRPSSSKVAVSLNAGSLGGLKYELDLAPLRSIEDVFEKAVDNALGAVTQTINKAIDGVVKGFSSVTSGVLDVVNKVGQFLGSVASSIVSFFGGGPSDKRDDAWLDDGDNKYDAKGGNDYVRGKGGNDWLILGSGNDTGEGWSGNDRLEGNDGNDKLSGDEGNDKLEGGWGKDTLYGGDGDDILEGHQDNDQLYGSKGSDKLEGGDGDDSLAGEQGNDLLYGNNGQDSLYGNDGQDLLDGGEGNDTLDGGSGNDRLYGFTGNDSVFGGDGNDDIHGWEGNDTLKGGSGNDILYGQQDNDKLEGGDGDDILYGDEGNDTLYGEGGNDYLFGGVGTDVLDGEDGNDVLNGGNGDDELKGGSGKDFLDGGDGNDSLKGEADNDTLFGRGGDDLLEGFGGNDLLNGGDGNDKLYSHEGDDTLKGEAGNDYLAAWTGNDLLDGGDGNDTLLGEAGNDTLSGGNGKNTLEGGDGNDTADYRFSGVGIVVNLAQGKATFSSNEDKLISIENIIGSANNDQINGDDQDNVLSGQAGNDKLLGEKGNDVLKGNEGNDELHGWEGNDTLEGGTGNDTLFGQQGNDSLEGGEGDDVLYGEGNGSPSGTSSNDTLSGGGGNDTLFGGVGDDYLDPGSGNDTIDGGDGNDTLLLYGRQDLYKFTETATGWRIVAPNDDVKIVTGVENFEFKSDTQVQNFDLNSVFNRDVIINYTGGVTDNTQTGLSSGTETLITQSFASFKAGGNGSGLPDNGFFRANVYHPNVQLGYNNSNNGNNALVITNNTSFVFTVTPKKYSQIHLFATSTNGNGDMQVRFFYSDGSSETKTATVPDWFDEIPTQLFDRYYLTDGLDRSLDTSGNNYHDVNDPAIFGFGFNLNSAKTLQYISINKSTGSGNNWLAVFGATGVSLTPSTEKLTTDTVRKYYSSRVIDGYIANGKIFFDANLNGVLDDNEPFTITQADGSFDLNVDVEKFDTNQDGELDYTEGKFVLMGGMDIIGGVDVSTGLLMTTPLTATVDSTVVTPLTTIIADIVQQGIDPATAQTKVKAALGLSSEVDLSSYDALEAIANGDINGISVFGSMIQVQNTIIQTAKFIDGVTETEVAQLAYAAISAMSGIMGTGSVINLDQVETIQTILQDAIAKAAQSDPQINPTQLAANAAAAAQIMALGNQIVKELFASGKSVKSIATDITKLQAVSVGEFAAGLSELAAGNVTVEEFLANNSKEAIFSQMEKVKVNDPTVRPTVDPTNVDQILPRLTNLNDVFNITSGNAKTTLQIQLIGNSSQRVNELGLFTVDDAEGTINGIAPGTAGYAQAALTRSRVILSALANTPNGFDYNNLSNILELNSGEYFRLLLVTDGTLDSVRNNPSSINNLLFSGVSTQKITTLGENAFSVGWKDPLNNNATDFNHLVVKIQQTNQILPLGINLQNDFQGEMIDLRDVQTSVKAEFFVYREAAYNNYVGFYQVMDQNGGIDTNNDGKVDLLIGQAGYAQAAVGSRVAGIDLAVSNQGSATLTSTFQPGGIFVPFMIVNGRPDELLDNNPNNDPAVYFPFLGANSDKVDHIRLLGSNTFGFEDLSGGGDRDFNDLIVKVNLSTLV